jgi:hypothetical protein
VFTDMAVAIADGADCVSHIEVCGDRHGVCGPVASMPTTWRLLDRIDDAHVPGVRTARAAARERAWAAGAAPDVGGLLQIDFDATITISHSEDKENAAKTWKRTFGFHPLLAFLDRPEVSGGEALAGLLRPGNAGSNTAADHITVLDQALSALPEHARPCPGDPDSVRVVARSDSAGATHAFAAACRDRGVWFSFGFPVDARIQAIVDRVPEHCWAPAIQTDGGIRDGAWVVEVTGMLDLAAWPEGSRVFLRAERPHPGAQLSFTDADGHRITAFITDIPDRVIPGQTAGRELNHRQHARVEDRIREAKNTGLRTLPCRGFAENTAGCTRCSPPPIWCAGPNSSVSPAHPRSLTPRSLPSATSYYTSPPASPTAPGKHASVSTTPGNTPTPSPKPGSRSAPPSPDPNTPAPRPERTRSSRHHSRSAASSRPSPPTTHSKINEPETRSTQHREKDRG